MSSSFEITTYIATALDPIHIGTGGYRIGRVDNTVLRDFDNVPKIPGTSIAGAVRSYAALQFSGKRECSGKDDLREISEGGGGRQCRKIDCPICVTFGYTLDTSSRVSMVNFSDARILFFPVSTMLGPVWVTSPSRLREFTKNGAEYIHEDDGKIMAVNDFELHNNRLNLGWVLLEKATDSLNLSDAKFSKLPPTVKKYAVCVTDRIFPLIINSNLEVRTSVSINPFTGAALEGALFTYEGVPRTAVFWFEVLSNDYSNFSKESNKYVQEVKKIFAEISNENSLQATKRVTRAGMDYCEILGLGGMSTRGFGRLQIEEVWNYGN